MGGGKGLDPQFPQGERLSGGKEAAQPFFGNGGYFHGQGIQGGSGGIHRQAELLGESGKAGNVVSVLMGDEDSGQGCWVHPKAAQGGGDALGRDARIQQDMSLAAGDQGGVAPLDPLARVTNDSNEGAPFRVQAKKAGAGAGQSSRTCAPAFYYSFSPPGTWRPRQGR